MIDDGLGGSFTEIHNSLTTSLTISNLKSGRTYRLKYAGRNIVYDQNNMYDCDKLQFSPIAEVLTAVIPSTATNLIHQTSLRYKDKLVIEWNESPDNGGAAIYKYTIAILDVATTVETETILSSHARSYTFLSLVPGKHYQVRIKTTNVVGDSAWTSYISTYPGINPTRPGQLTFASATRNTLSLTWSALTGEDTGGTLTNPITIANYHLYMDNGYNGQFNLVVSTTSTSYTVENIIPGLKYRFKLQAENAISLLSPFSTEQTMMSGTIPSAPSKPILKTQSSSSIQFYWNAPFDNGGSEITEYELLITKVSDSSTLTKSIINSNQYLFNAAEGLASGLEYQFKIRAKNFITEFYSLTGDWSAVATFYSSDLPVRVSSLTQSGLTKTDVSVNWTLHSVDSDKGYSTTDPVYKLYMDDCNGGLIKNLLLSTTTLSTYAVSNITPGK